MARYYILNAIVVAFVAITAFALPQQQSGEKDVQKIQTEVQVVDNIKNFRSAYPLLKMTPLSRSAGPNPKGQIIYTLGRRVGGDRLVAQNGDSQLFGSLQDVRLVLTYPQSGVGATISYVEISVDQSSNIGDGYVIDGGIGQRSITIVIEAERTTFFTYVAQIFGY